MVDAGTCHSKQPQSTEQAAFLADLRTFPAGVSRQFTYGSQSLVQAMQSIFNP